MPDRVTERRRVVKVRDGTSRPSRDALAVEEPVEIRVNGAPVSVTMRTPGDDFDLALGFCLTEGIVAGHDLVETVRYCTPSAGPYSGDFNVVEIATRDARPPDPSQQRQVYTASSCGICGTASIDLVRKRAPAVHDDPLRLSAEVLAGLPATLRAGQRIFEQTGGLHAAGLFTADGELVCVREDVGRHNAVDKVVGWAARERRLPLRGHLLMVSGRVAFEIVQKALWAGIPAIAAVSAPSNLAVALAEEAGMTLVGFLRGSSMNVYAGAARMVDLSHT